MKLAAVRIFVSELAAARRFYRDLLGLGLAHEDARAGYCAFQGGAAQVIVEEVPPDAPEDERILVGRFLGLSFEVPDLQAEHARLLALGVHFTGAPERQAWGGQLATFVDPSGNQLQLVQYPRRGD